MREIEQIKEAIDVVDTLNDLWYEQTKDENTLPFTLVYATGWKGIKFMDEVVWDDQDNDCDYIDRSEDCELKESILTCTKRRTEEFLKMFKKFKPAKG